MDRLNWIPVDSSVLSEVAYQPEILWVRFRSGEIYRYGNVPPEIFRGLLAAESHGRFFNPAFAISSLLSKFTVPLPEPNR